MLIKVISWSLLGLLGFCLIGSWFLVDLQSTSVIRNTLAPSTVAVLIITIIFRVILSIGNTGGRGNSENNLSDGSFGGSDSGCGGDGGGC